MPLTRQAIVQHHDPFGEPCPKVSVVQVYTFVPSREIVRVKATCSRCGWVGLRIVPRDS